MKVILQKISEGQDEIIIRFRQRTEEIESLIKSIEQRKERIYAQTDGIGIFIHPNDVLYMESVDGSVYVYSKDSVAKTELPLAMAKSYIQVKVFGCSKSKYHICVPVRVGGIPRVIKQRKKECK